MKIRFLVTSFMIFGVMTGGHVRVLSLILPYRGGCSSLGQVRSRMRPRQAGQSLATKTDPKKEALPKRNDAIFEDFGNILANGHADKAEALDPNPSLAFQHIRSFLKEKCHSGSSLVISISGGVDSMVLSHSLVVLRSHWRLNLSAVHIDYNIRPTSRVEAAFVETWARKVALPLTLVRLNGTKSLSRAEFEDFSRKARYEAYQKVMQDTNAIAVLTGHHEDDAAENVLSNLFMGRSLFHIPVMGPEAVLERVRIWRPFFRLPKKAIYAFAAAHEIPYLKNIDAPSGRRAVLHGKVIPSLEDAFGRRTIQNIARVGQSAKDWKEIIDQHILAPLWQQVRCFPQGAIVPFGGFPLLEAFWEEAFVGIFHAMGCSMLSKRSVAQVVAALRLERSRWLPIHREFDLFIDTKESHIVIANSKLFSGPHEMGCWKVNSQETADSSVNGLVGLLNGYVIIPSKQNGYEERLKLPAEVVARLPSPETIKSFGGFTGCLSDERGNLTFHLTAETALSVRYPCDVSRVLLKE